MLELAGGGELVELSCGFSIGGWIWTLCFGKGEKYNDRKGVTDSSLMSKRKMLSLHNRCHGGEGLGAEDCLLDTLLQDLCGDWLH